MFIALILTDGRFFIGAIDMSILLAMLARATDTKGYPDDKNPDNWKTINHAHVHLDNSGNIDGGAGEKFKGNAWTSEKHPFKGAPKPKPTTKEDLDAAWKKVVKYKVAMNQSKSQTTYEKHAQNLQNAIEEYKKLESLVPEGTPKPKHNVENMEQHAAKPYASKEPLAALAEATAPELGINDYIKLCNQVSAFLLHVDYGAIGPNDAPLNAQTLLNKGFNADNYNKFSLDEKKAVWGAFGGKQEYINAVEKLNKLAGNDISITPAPYSPASPLQGLANATAPQGKEAAINAITQNLDKGLDALFGSGSESHKAELAKSVVEAGLTLENLAKLDDDDVAEIEHDNSLDHGELGVYIDDIEMLAKKATKGLQSSSSSAKMGSNGLAKLVAATTVYKAKSFKPKAISTLKKVKMLDAQAADDLLHDVVGKVWKKASNSEKWAAYDYTASYSKYNEPLRGIVYGTSQYVGPGNVDMDQIGVGYKGFKPGEVKAKINALTNIIDKCALPQDMQLMRGCDWKGMGKFFGKSIDWLKHASNADLQSIVGKTVTDHGFMSTGCAEGKGFTHEPIIMHIYAPKGTKGIYVEPFSEYGWGTKSPGWDGEEKFNFYASEQEVVLQRSTSLMIKSIKRENGELHVEMQVVSQDPQYLA